MQVRTRTRGWPARFDDAWLAIEGFQRFEMGSTLAGVSLYKLKGYSEMEEIDVPVGGGRSISVVRMAKPAR